MYIKKVHILIEQGLQQNGVFAYEGFLKEEIDLQIDKAGYTLLNKRIKPLALKGFQKNQGILDEFQELQIKNLELTNTKEDNVYIALLPSNYVHLISDKSLVLWLCDKTPVLTTKIEKDKYYVVSGSATITYNLVAYATGTVFKGVVNVTTFTASGGLTLVHKLNTRESDNRLTKEEDIARVLDNTLSTTSVESPVSTLSNKKLYTYSKDFFVGKTFISYIRKPKPVNYNFSIVASGTIIQGVEYEVVKDSIVYNGQTLNKFDTFTGASSINVFTGTGVVRKALDGDLELSESMTYSIIDRVVEVLGVISEQSQQKIVNLAQQNNVSS